jgi:peptidoglycan/LPS O-acetylase OafA/YrhL
LLVSFVWLAAQRRKNWPRWVLAAALVLSVISLVQVIGDSGVQFDSGIEVVSCALTAAGCIFPSPATRRAGSTRELAVSGTRCKAPPNAVRRTAAL